MSIPGTTVVTAPVAPSDALDTYPSHAALWGKGGLRTVATLGERDTIPTLRREAGMLVYVIDEAKYYQLGADLASWTEFSSGEIGSGGGGEPGEKGWSPILALYPDGSRVVQQVTDWTGGEGAKPATGQFIGSTGLVPTAAEAVDVRGPQGLQGEQGATQLRASRYQFSTTTTPPPVPGEVRLDNSSFPTVTTLWINETNLDGTDIALALQTILEGQRIVIQKRDDHSSFASYVVTGAFTDSGSYITFPVAFDSVGAGPALVAGEVTVFIMDPQGGGGGGGNVSTSGGTGTFIPIWESDTAIGNSLIYQDGSTIEVLGTVHATVNIIGAGLSGAYLECAAPNSSAPVAMAVFEADPASTRVEVKNLAFPGDTDLFLRADGIFEAPTATLDDIPESTVLGREAGDGAGAPNPIPFNAPIQAAAATTSTSALRAAIGIDRRFAPLFTEFLAHNSLPNTNMGLPWWGLTVGTGTATNFTPAEAEHPGIVQISAAAATNTGWGYVTQITNIFIRGGEKTQIVFRIPVSNADFVMRYGFQDSHTTGATSNAAFFRVAGLVFDGFMRKDGAAGTITATNFTLLVNTWYTAQVEFLPDGQTVRYTLWDAAGVEKWTDTTFSATNAPANRATGHGLIAYRTANGGSTNVILHVDYMDLQMGLLTR